MTTTTPTYRDHQSAAADLAEDYLPHITTRWITEDGGYLGETRTLEIRLRAETGLAYDALSRLQLAAQGGDPEAGSTITATGPRGIILWEIELGATTPRAVVEATVAAAIAAMLEAAS